MDMKIRFLGGAEKVGSLGMLLEDKGTSLLFDYGMTPSSPPSYPLPAPQVDGLFLSHAHVDHSGMVPWLCSRRNVDVHTLPPTMDVTTLLAEDSNKICDLEGYPKQYDQRDILAMQDKYRPLSFGQVRMIGGLDVITHPAGHIPGAAMFQIKGEKKALFTGDINSSTTGLAEGVKPTGCDILFLESTYSGRDHEPRQKTEHAFISKVEEVVDRGGTAVLPAFAVGRTQELMLLLMDKGFETWVDGMGRTITDIFLGHGKYIRNARKLKKAKATMKAVRNTRSRGIALRDAEVIITTSGMLDGGPVLFYLDTLMEDTKNAIILTGYQVEGTNGRMLMEQGLLKVKDANRKPKCEISFFDLSAHSGHSELAEFARACRPDKVVLMHGDNRESLAQELSDMEVLLPETDRTYSL